MGAALFHHSQLTLGQRPAALQQPLQQGAQGAVGRQLRQALAGAMGVACGGGCTAQAARTLDSVAQGSQRQGAGTAGARVGVCESQALKCRHCGGGKSGARVGMLKACPAI